MANPEHCNKTVELGSYRYIPELVEVGATRSSSSQALSHPFLPGVAHNKIGYQGCWSHVQMDQETWKAVIVHSITRATF